MVLTSSNGTVEFNTPEHNTVTIRQKLRLNVVRESPATVTALLMDYNKFTNTRQNTHSITLQHSRSTLSCLLQRSNVHANELHRVAAINETR
jgi:hypothetical protein